jgi:hypothetical protein
VDSSKADFDEAIHSEKRGPESNNVITVTPMRGLYFVGKCYIMRALDRFITEFERSPGLHRPEQWKTFVTTMTYGRNIEFPLKHAKRVSGNVRMVSCDPE